MHETEQYENPADCTSSWAMSTRGGNEKEAGTRPYGLVRGRKTETKKEGVRHDVLQRTRFDKNNTAVARQRNEEGIERRGPGGRMTVLEVDEEVKSFETMFS